MKILRSREMRPSVNALVVLSAANLVTPLPLFIWATWAGLTLIGIRQATR